MGTNVSVSIDVANVVDAVEFYTQALECSQKKEYSESWVVVEFDGLDIHLLKREAGSQGAGGEKRHFNRHWTPVHLDFGVANVKEAAKRVEVHGGLVEEIKTSEQADIAHCADPYGNGFCLIRE